MALLNLMRFPQALFLSLPPWIATLQSSSLTATLSLVSSTNLLRVHPISLLTSPTKMLNNTGPNAKLCGMPLVTILQPDIKLLVTNLCISPPRRFTIHEIVDM